MNQYRISDSGTTYTRISKVKARKLHATGTPIYLIAHKMRPGFPFSLGMIMPDVERMESESFTFDKYVRNFEWYNANCNETGLYSSFYTMAEVTK
jgi:hypothetical protein